MLTEQLSIPDFTAAVEQEVVDLSGIFGYQASGCSRLLRDFG
jgi:hypothetical protein